MLLQTETADVSGNWVQYFFMKRDFYKKTYA